MEAEGERGWRRVHWWRRDQGQGTAMDFFPFCDSLCVAVGVSCEFSLKINGIKKNGTVCGEKISRL